MNLCNIHNQWYVTHCVYCGKPGESKIQDLQVSEPFVIELTDKQWEQLKEVEEALDDVNSFNQKLHDLFNLTRSKDAKRQTKENHPPKRFRDIGNAE